MLKTARATLARPNIKAFLVIFGILAAVYALPLAMGRSQNPVLQRSGLAVGVQPGFVSGQSTIDPNDGFTSQALGGAAAQSWLRGDVPYWNHNEGVGMPLAGGMQSAAFLPIVLLMKFGKGLVLFHFILQLVAGFTAYLFLKRLKLRFWVALLGGVLFMFNGTFAWLTNAAFNPVAFLPMLLLGLELAFDRATNRRRGGWVLIAVALSLSLYSGFPETAFINALFAYGWAFVRLFQLETENRLAYIRKIVAGSLVGLLLTAPLLVAFLGYLPYANTGGHDNDAYAKFGLPMSTLPALVMPYIFGPIFGFIKAGKPVDLFVFWSNVGGYITMPLVLLATLGLTAKKAMGQKLYLAIFVAVILLKNFAFKPVLLVVNLIPGMSRIAFYRYSIPVLSMALIILAMWGVEAFVRSEVSKKKLAVITAALVGLVGLLSWQAHDVLDQLGQFPSHRYWAILSILCALSIIGVFGLSFFGKRIRLAGIWLLLVADAVVMFAVPMLSIPNVASVDYGPVRYLQQNLQLSRFYTLHPIAPNYSSYFNIASINLNDLPVPKNWAEYIPEKLDSNAAALLFTGDVRVNANGPDQVEEFGRNIEAYQGLAVKYLVTNPQQLKQPFIDQHQLKLVYRGPNADIYELPAAKSYFQTTAACSFGQQTKDQLEVNCPAASELLRRELFMPGWSATVNGRAVAITNDDEIFQAIDLPAGQSTIKYSYSPPYIWLGYLGLALGLAAIVGSVFVLQPAPKTSAKSDISKVAKDTQLRRRR